SPGNANAHLSFSRGMSAAFRPADAASWKRVLLVFCPQPVHRGPAFGSKAVEESEHRAAGAGVVTTGFNRDLPVRYSASARRSATVLPFAIVTIEPVSIAASTRSAGLERNASRAGARLAAESWPCAQVRLYNSAPSGVCAGARDADPRTTIELTTTRAIE